MWTELRIGTELVLEGGKAKAKQLVKDVFILPKKRVIASFLRRIPLMNVTSQQVNDGSKVFGEALKETIK